MGYKVPLFLGGEDDISNLEEIDMEVYWSVTGQLNSQC
ncbi:T6SS immunity protein Tdi1 domain-containing protein [Terrisporobacter vanillatitrophus]